MSRMMAAWQDICVGSSVVRTDLLQRVQRVYWDSSITIPSPAMIRHYVLDSDSLEFSSAFYKFLTNFFSTSYFVLPSAKKRGTVLLLAINLHNVLALESKIVRTIINRRRRDEKRRRWRRKHQLWRIGFLLIFHCQSLYELNFNYDCKEDS